MLCLTLFLVYNKFLIFFKYQGLYLLISYLNHKYFNYFIIYLIFSFLYKYYNNFFLFIFFLYHTVNLYVVKVQTIPITLLMGLNNIHPPLFYISFILFLSFICRIYTFSFKTLNILYLAAISLILGGFWGLGNSVWGFFWVNDSIEIILLCYVILLLVLIHNYSAKINTYVFIYAYLIASVYLLRINFTFTRHSFFDLRKIENIFIHTCIFLVSNYLFLIINLFFSFNFIGLKFFYINIFLLIFLI